jgi:Saccharopine dehydrogenase C-terminal domain
VRDFVRGTIRLNGWAKAWDGIFRTIEGLEGAPVAEVDAKLTTIANDLLKENSYAEGEADRVILFVSLKATRDGKTVFHETWAMDAWGDARGTAMSRLVSIPVSLGVDAVAKGRVEAGVHPAPHDPALIAEWMAEVAQLSQYLARIDHLS